MQTSRARRDDPREKTRRSGKGGFTLLEMLLAIAVMGLVMAIVLPNIPRTLESNADRRAVFQFQRLVLDLRASAYREEQAIVVVNSGEFQDDPEAEPRPAEIKFDDGWTYRLSAPLNISARGLCEPVDVDLFFQDSPRMRLHGGSDCGFTWERVR